MEREYVAQNIKFIRKTMNYTQDEFAKRLNIKRSSVGAYEEGRALPRIDTLLTIEKVFKVSLLSILHDDMSIVGFVNYSDKPTKYKERITESILKDIDDLKVRVEKLLK